MGATARDLLLESAHGLASKRATADIDIAVILENWQQFDQFKNALVKSFEFEPSREAQRIIFRDRLPVDIIPFGGVAGDNDHIAWPPDRTLKMSVAGFEECYQHSIPVQLSDSPELVIKTATLAALAILKLISWHENQDRRRRDAPDLCSIIENYLDAGNLDRLFDEAFDLVDADDYDYELASAHLLGRDLSKIASSSTRNCLLRILDEESRRPQGHRIAMDVLQSNGYRWFHYDRVVAYFDSMLKGLTESENRAL